MGNRSVLGSNKTAVVLEPSQYLYPVTLKHNKRNQKKKKLGKQLEMTNYILYIPGRLLNNRIYM